MTRFTLMLLVALVASSLSADGPKQLVISGFLRSRSVEPVRASPGTDWAYKIMELAPEGKRVEPGEVVARIEGKDVAENQKRANVDYLQTKVNNEGKITQLKQDLQTLEESIASEEKQLEMLNVDAASAGDSDVLAWTRSGRSQLIDKLDVEARQIKVKKLKEKLNRKRQLLAASEAQTEQSTATAKMWLDRYENDLKASEIKAKSKGVVVYRLHPWRREKPKIGGEIYRGMAVLDIVDDHRLFVEAFLREENWSYLKKGAEVDVKIVSPNEPHVKGRVKDISTIVMKVMDWDRSLPDSHYLAQIRAFRVEIDLDSVPDDAKPNGEVVVKVL